MAITYTLTPNILNVAPQQSGEQNVVIGVAWSYSATDGVYVSDFCGNTQVAYVPGNPYTPYANLTEAQVAGWVTSSWSADQTTQYQKQLADLIAKQQISSTAAPPLPWS